MIEEVDRAKKRSLMSVNESLKHLGIARGTFYRWKNERAWRREKAEPVTPVQAFEALAEKKRAVIDFALKHPEVRHRELSWRMIDEDEAYLSASTVYRILQENELAEGKRVRSNSVGHEICAVNFPSFWHAISAVF